MKPTILVVDDDIVVRGSLAKALESEGFEVYVASSGREAISNFHEVQPGLVLLDIHLSDIDGWQVYEIISQWKPLAPVIVITAQPNQLTQAQGVGVDVLMEKPLDIPQLITTIKTLFDETRNERVRRMASPYFQTAFFPGNGTPD